MEKGFVPLAEGGSRWRWVRATSCWLFAVGGLLVAMGMMLSPEAWPDDRVSGGGLAVGSVVLLPPILRRLRRRVPFTRSIMVPLIYAVLLGPLASVVGKPFVPPAAEQERLQHVAIRRAELKLREGRPAEARTALRKFSSRRPLDPTIVALLARIDDSKPAVPKEQLPSGGPLPKPGLVPETIQDPASAYVERVETYWLPEVHGMPDSPPADDAAFGRLLTQIDGMVVNIADVERFALSPSQRLNWQTLVDALAAKQKRLLPALRRRYADELRAKLFRHDVGVIVSGKGNGTVRFTGPMFVRNANIEDLQAANGAVLTRLRFRRIEYRWSRYRNDGYHYDLEVPSDGVVAAWNGDALVPINK